MYLKLSLVVSLGFLILFGIAGLYGAEKKRKLQIEEIAEAYKIIVLGGLILFSLSFFFPREYLYSRLVGAYSIVLALVLISLERMAFQELISFFHKRGYGVEKTLVYGTGKAGRDLAKRIQQMPQLGYLPIGFIDDEKKEISIEVVKNPHPFSLPILGTFHDLKEIIRESKAGKILVALPKVSPEERRRMIEKCEKLGIDYAFILHTLSIMPHRVTVEDIGGMPLISSKEYRPGIWHQVLKRGFDIVFSLLVLTLLFPVFLVICLLIKRDSRGPAIFPQRRVGKDGNEFILYKFRTMYVDTPSYASCPEGIDDPRITPFGRWLRRTSLDELPQFINIVKGEMSVVGPRPEMPFIVEGYNDLQRERLKVKPGITGPWQISADRASAIHENMEYDLYYIQNQSFFLDMAIVFSTIISAIRGVGAF